MKVVVAIDSFKNSLSSYEAGQAVKAGILAAYRGEAVDVVVKSLADGGEGTVDTLVAGMNGKKESLQVHGPLMKPVTCEYGILEQSNTAIIEMAAAAGIELVASEERNPMNTTTYGVGEIIRHAIGKGIRKFIIGIGGSATNDCGVGMLQALGYEFLDAEGSPVGTGGKVLSQIKQIDDSNVLKELKECKFQIACDVTNPLFGKNGASYVFAPQKGATQEMVKELNQGSMRFADIVNKAYQTDYAYAVGAGAAGGLGYAFLSFLSGRLESGIKIILDEIQLAKELEDADLVVTGEGKLDAQTVMGKAPIGVAKLAKQKNCKVIAFAGTCEQEAKKCNDYGIDAFFSIGHGPMTLEEAMNPENAAKNMAYTAEQVFRLIRTVRG